MLSAQVAFTYSKLIIETLEKDVKRILTRGSVERVSSGVTYRNRDCRCLPVDHTTNGGQ